MKRKCRALLQPYQTALHRYLQGRAAAKSPAALHLGRQAVAGGLDTLDLGLIHEEALRAQMLSASTPAACARIVRRAKPFFAEAILPIEETHRTALEANAHLNRLNQALSRRTRELLLSNRQLQGQIARRKVATHNLRQSRQLARRLLDQSHRLQEQLRQLSRRILSAQEDERKRISRELHDVIAQLLTGINVRLATLRVEASASNQGLNRKIAHTQRLIEKSVDIVHRFARELRPAVLDDLGLIPALHALMKAMTNETGLRGSLTACAEVEALSGATRTALYRVAQEALTNVVRHAHASRVEVHIQRLANTMRMRIQDDGQSFPVARMWHTRKGRHLGILGMRERVEMIGGTFEVVSAPGHGTTIQAQVPLGRDASKRRTP